MSITFSILLNKGAHTNCALTRPSFILSSGPVITSIIPSYKGIVENRFDRAAVELALGLFVRVPIQNRKKNKDR